MGNNHAHVKHIIKSCLSYLVFFVIWQIPWRRCTYRIFQQSYYHRCNYLIHNSILPILEFHCILYLNAKVNKFLHITYNQPAWPSSTGLTGFHLFGNGFFESHFAIAVFLCHSSKILIYHFSFSFLYPIDTTPASDSETHIFPIVSSSSQRKKW